MFFGLLPDPSPSVLLFPDPSPFVLLLPDPSPSTLELAIINEQLALFELGELPEPSPSTAKAVLVMKVKKKVLFVL